MIEAIKSAVTSILHNKVRSILTVLGVVIGVASVTILVSLGQGLKNDVSGLIRGFGSNLMFVVAGKVDTKGGSQATNPANFVAGDILTTKDIDAIKKVKGVTSVAPMALVAGVASSGGKPIAATLIGTYPNFNEAIQVLKIKDGKMFTSNADGNVIVIGPKLKTTIFGDGNAIGNSFQINKEDFKVIGVFDQVTASSVFGNQFDTIAVMPFDTATRLNKGKVNINRIVIKAADNAKVKDVKKDVTKAILDSHAGEDNFTVLTQDDILGLFDQFLTLATTLVSAIAAISLIVGGIGIMNIMLVTVTERTKEIGLRKAVGATKFDIALQFLVEAIIITLMGGLIGLAISFGVGQIVAAKTSLHPAITIGTIATALGVSTVIGVIFGLWPALRAAGKDPIQALRYE